MLPRWLTGKVAEYDTINEFWATKNIKTEKGVDEKLEFFAFSSTVYLNETSMVVLGGLDDRVPSLPDFSKRALHVTQNLEN
jgi:hypothetical protein